MKYYHQTQPTKIPTTDGKIIEEHLGLASSGHGEFSVAHMIAPPGWKEPPQQPEFDEITIMVRGKKEIVIEGDKIILQAGETLWIKKGVKVQYSNPFDEPAEYFSVCIPAFSIESVHRE